MVPTDAVWTGLVSDKLEFTQNDKYIIMVIDKFYIARFSGLHRLTRFAKLYKGTDLWCMVWSDL